MSTLPSWKRIDRVISKRPFGDGKDGVATINSDPNTRATITGTSGQNTSTLGSAILQNGDLVKITQTQGSGAGENWEYNMVLSGGGTTSIVWKENLHYSYITGAQVIKIPRYSVANVKAHTITAWDGSKGGDEEIVAKIVYVDEAVSGVGKGFRGGTGAPADSTQYANYGESHAGASGNSNNLNANDSGGGGGGNPTNSINGWGGGGGGHKDDGQRGATPPDSALGGYGGAGSKGSDDLLTLTPGAGGGGGGGAHSNDTGILSHKPGGNGGDGGAILHITADKLVVTASIDNSGEIGGDGGLVYSQPGFNGMSGSGGGGAGGAILVTCRLATLGTGLLVANAGSKGASNGGAVDSGKGSVGRIAIHHSGQVTGATSPTFVDVSDATLVEIKGGSMIQAM